MSGLSFRFLDAGLNRQLTGLLKRARIAFSQSPDGTIQYSPLDEVVVENELIKSIRDRQFSNSWQVISCPEDWAARYREYMQAHAVPFLEERIDGRPCFVLSRRYRPHSWKLETDRPVRRKQSAAS